MVCKMSMNFPKTDKFCNDRTVSNMFKIKTIMMTEVDKYYLQENIEQYYS